MSTIGVAVAIPEPWATQLQDYRADIGDLIEKRPVSLMPDGADDRCSSRGYRTDKVFAAEGQQVLHGTAAPRDDDDVDVVPLVKLFQRAAHLRDCVDSLDGNFPYLEFNRRPPQGGIPQDILFGVRIPSGN